LICIVVRFWCCIVVSLKVTAVLIYGVLVL